MHEDLDTAGATHDRAGEGRHHAPPSGAVREEAGTQSQDATDWRAMVAARAAAVRRSVAAMPPTKPLPPR